MINLYGAFTRLMETIPYALIAIVARFAASVDFWRSGQSKLDGDALLGVKWNFLNVAEKKYFLFENVYHIPGPLAPAMTHFAAAAEFLFPILLVFGLFTRVGALGLLVMTIFIQFYVFPEELLKANGNWSVHLLWAAPLLLLLARGPGAISLDNLLGRRR